MMLFLSCERNTIEPENEYENKAVVVNEGPFPNGSGSLTVFDRNTHESGQEVFLSANGRPLGNVVQSATIHLDVLYVAVNNSNKLEIAHIDSFVSIASLDVSLPRYFLGVSEEKGYVSSWNDEVYVVDLVENRIGDTISCPTGPDRMVLAGGKVFVLNSGGFQNDNRVTVIDPQTDQLVAVVTVGDNPSGAVVDRDDKLWVLCAGKGWNGFPSADDTPGSLYRIDPLQNEIERSIIFTDPSVHPSRLAISEERNRLYVLSPEGVAVMGIDDAELSSPDLIPGNFYGMDVDPSNGMIYLTDPVDYVQNGWVYAYLPDGSLADSLRAGIIPSSIAFP